MSSPCEFKDKTGLNIEPISKETFGAFAKRFASSPEIGPIFTCLDKDARPSGAARRHVIGLSGCDKLCAVACFELFNSKTDSSVQVVKLDSIIVDPELRRRSLAGILVAQGLSDLVNDDSLNIARIYAHSVHPATVRMLIRLAFNDPPPTGAPISHFSIENRGAESLLQTCEAQLRDQIAQKRLQCEFCRTKSRRARPWCKPRGI